MARIRTIKPEFFIDFKVGQLSHTARLLFIGLWCQADDEGRLQVHPIAIKGLIFPFDDVDMDAALQELIDIGMIDRYGPDEEPILSIPHFLEHQRISHPSKSKIPSREEWEESRKNSEDSASPRESSGGFQSPREMVVGKGKERKGKERNMERNMEREGNGEESEEDSGNDPLPAVEDVPVVSGNGSISKTEPTSVRNRPEEIVELWNSRAPPECPRVTKMTNKRRKHVLAKLKEFPDFSEWETAIGKIGQSDFLVGKNDRGWVATFDWLVERADSITRLIEGAYGSRASPQRSIAGSGDKSF